MTTVDTDVFVVNCVNIFIGITDANIQAFINSFPVDTQMK